MSAVGIGLAWMALTMAAFMALSATAIARGRRELEVELAAEPECRGETSGAGGAIWLCEATTAGSNVSVATCHRCPRARACAGSSSPTQSISWARGWPM
jgi:hypothetical protein